MYCCNYLHLLLWHCHTPNFLLDALNIDREDVTLLQWIIQHVITKDDDGNEDLLTEIERIKLRGQVTVRL